MNFKCLAAASMLALAASAGAQEAAPIPLVLAPSGAGMFGATFERSVTGLAVDTFTFTPPAFAGSVAVAFTPLAGPINFFSALLNGQGFSFDPDAGESTFAFRADVTADMPLELQLLVFAGDTDTLTAATGRYGGAITATAVTTAIPEPQTYALLLAGLALLAWWRARANVGAPRERFSQGRGLSLANPGT